MFCLDALTDSWSLVCPRKREPLFIFVEGNLAVGKSECVEYCAELLREKGKTVKCFAEETKRWSEANIMRFDREHSVGDAAARVFVAYGPLRDYLERERFFRSEEIKDFDVVLLERHPSTVLDVFHDEDDVVRDLFDKVSGVTGVLVPPKHTVYISSTPIVCHERVKRRNDPRETHLTEDSLHDLETKLEDALRRREAEGGKVHRIDAFGATSNHVSAMMCEYVEKLLA